ncbi:MAG: 1-deoxy-D-xylulose-5-phosphate reductoisomerase [Pseudomonadota bacterium]
MNDPISVSIMGATGSIGQSSLDVISRANSQCPPDAPAFTVVALAANSNAEALADQALRVRPEIAVVADERRLEDLERYLAGSGIEAAGGEQAVVEAALRPCDKLLAAISGSAGLASTLAAVRAGRTVALANKESIVCAGHLLLTEARRTGATILPVDSEHNAIFQAWQSGKAVERLTITASGGPFRNASETVLRTATPDLAKAHPNWDMGPKNSIDSATLMNKALEFIEASYLFGIDEAQIDVVIHPQSIVHGMAHFIDGSVLAQLSMPDMRTPIAHALAWPERVRTDVRRLALEEIGRLDFEPVDDARFPAVGYARQASRSGNAAATLLNSANEAAVAAFIAGECGFLDISWVVGEVLEHYSETNFAGMACETLEEVTYLDQTGRRLATDLLRQAPGR